MRNLLDDYKEVKDCIYKGETYSVRDNGAVLRHSRIGKRVRKEDDIWTFGKANEQTGYMNYWRRKSTSHCCLCFLRGATYTPTCC